MVPTLGSSGTLCSKCLAIECYLEKKKKTRLKGTKAPQFSVFHQVLFAPTYNNIVEEKKCLNLHVASKCYTQEHLLSGECLHKNPEAIVCETG